MAHVFISYKRDDMAFAKEVEAQLESAGFDVWRDNRMDGGKDWLAEIEQKLRDSFAVIVVVTPEAIPPKELLVKSISTDTLRLESWVLYEWIYARGANKEVVPIRLKGVDPANLPYRLSDRNLIDFGSHYDWDKLIKRLREIKEEIGLSIPVPPNAPYKIRQAIIALNSWNPDEQSAAIGELANSGNSIVIPALATVLQDHKVNSNGEEVGERATRGLMKLNNRDSTPFMLDLLKHEDPKVRHRAVRVLVTLEDASAVDGLLEIVNDPEPIVRREAIFCLGILNSTKTIPSLCRVLERDTDVGARTQAAVSLGKIQSPSGIPGLISALKDNESSVKSAAIVALGTINHPDSVSALTIVLHNEEDPILRLTALESLANFGDSSSIPDFLKALRNPDERVRQLAAKLLVAMGKDAIPGLSQAVRDQNSEVRLLALRTLGEIGDTSAIPAYLEALADDDIRVAGLAVNLLVHTGNEGIPKLLEKLYDANYNVQEQAISRLTEVGDPLAIPYFAHALSHGDVVVRMAALRAVKQMGDATAVPGLINALYDGPFSEDIARDALIRIGAEAVPILVQHLQNRGPMPLPRGHTLSFQIEGLISQIGEAAVPGLIDALNNSDYHAHEMVVELLTRIGTPEALAAVEQWQRERGGGQA